MREGEGRGRGGEEEGREREGEEEGREGEKRGREGGGTKLHLGCAKPTLMECRLGVGA